MHHTYHESSDAEFPMQHSQNQIFLQHNDDVAQYMGHAMAVWECVGVMQYPWEGPFPLDRNMHFTSKLLPLLFPYTSFIKKLNGAMVPSQWTRPHSTQLTLLCTICQEVSRFNLIRSEGGPVPSQCKPPFLHQILTAYVSSSSLDRGAAQG